MKTNIKNMNVKNTLLRNIPKPFMEAKKITKVNVIAVKKPLASHQTSRLTLRLFMKDKEIIGASIVENSLALLKIALDISRLFMKV